MCGGQVPKLPLAVARVGGIHEAVLQVQDGIRKVTQGQRPLMPPPCLSAAAHSICQRVSGGAEGTGTSLGSRADALGCGVLGLGGWGAILEGESQKCLN